MLIGSVTLVVGAALLFWTRSVLGWRRLLGLENEPPHPGLPRLVFAGPYRLVRHPLVLSIIMMLAGVTLVIGLPGLGVLLAVVCVALLLLARGEERRLVSRFGGAYQRYQQVVPFVVPWPQRCGGPLLDAERSR